MGRVESHPERSSRRAEPSSVGIAARVPAHVVPLDELEAFTMNFAKRMTLIAPEALEKTKLAINRGADCGGFRNAMQAGLDIVAPIYAAKTEVGLKFTEIRLKDGLPAALKWRREQFAQYE